MAISDAVSQSHVARVLGIETLFENKGSAGSIYLPQSVMVFAQGNEANTYVSTKRQVFSHLEVANVEGFGSPAHLSVMQLFPDNGDGVGSIPVILFPLQKGAAAVVAAGDITTVGSATAASSFKVRVNEIDSQDVVIAVGDAGAEISPKMVTAINAILEMPIIPTDNVGVLDFDTKWNGVTANEVFIEIIGGEDSGLTFSITQATGGLVNPTVSAALAQIGPVWNTLGINPYGEDTDILDEFATFNEGRWGALVRKPLAIARAGLETVVATAITVSDARKTDRTNIKLMEVGGHDFTWVIAARQIARVVVLAQNNPPFDYGGQKATGLTPGDDGDQWNDTEKDAAVKGGCSTSDSVDSVVTISDIVTHYHPTGEANPGYRYLVDLMKLWNTIFNIDLEFTKAEWDGAPLIPDDEPTTNATAKKPKHARAAAGSIVRRLGLDAILADTATTIPLIQAAISSTNPKRLDLSVPVTLSGNTNIISATIKFSFFFGTAAIVE